MPTWLELVFYVVRMIVILYCLCFMAMDLIKACDEYTRKYGREDDQ